MQNSGKAKHYYCVVFSKPCHLLEMAVANKACSGRLVRGAFFRLFLNERWFPFPSLVPHQPPLTQAVETVEKVPFQKLTFEKWDRIIEKRLVFCVLNNILAIFEPVVGDFCESFSNKGFFDSLVGQPRAKVCWLNFKVSWLNS